MEGAIPVLRDSLKGTTGRFACPDHENEGRCYRLDAGLDPTGGIPAVKLL